MTGTAESTISPGDKVVVLLPTKSSKMTDPWKGLLLNVRKLSDAKQQVNVGEHLGLVTYHIHLLKRYNRNIVMNIHSQLTTAMVLVAKMQMECLEYNSLVLGNMCF